MYVLNKSGLVESISEATRLIKQGAVSRDGARITDPKAQVPVGSDSIYKVGKRRFKRIRIEPEKPG